VAEAVYEVHGVAEGASTLLGTTSLTAFVAPAGFSSYVVKFRDDAGVHEVPDVCVWIEWDGPRVGYQIDC
jgi:hypothetical protein